MFIYHGIVDQNTAQGPEFMFAILPTIVKKGASFIGFRYRSNSHGLHTIDYFSTQIETMKVSPDEKLAKFTSANVTMQLPSDMKALRIHIHYSASREPVSSSMVCIMEHSLIRTDSFHRELSLFLGPLEMEGQLHGNVIALMVSKKQGSGQVSVPDRLCLAWDSKTATGEHESSAGILPNNHEENEFPIPHFTMQNESHDLEATLSQTGDTLHLSLRGRYEDDSDSLNKISHQHHHHRASLSIFKDLEEVLQRISYDIVPDHTMTVINSSEVSGNNVKDQTFVCTITKVTSDDVNEFLTHAGLALAVVGLFAGLPTFPVKLGVGVAVGGFSLAVAPYIQILISRPTEVSKLLYPGDSVQLAATGWTSRSIFMVELVERDVYIENGRTHLRTTRYTNAFHATNDNMNPTAHTGPFLHNKAYDSHAHISSIFLDASLKLFERRILFIEGLTTASDGDEHKSQFPLSLETGAVIEYPDKDRLNSYNPSEQFTGTYHTPDYWRNPGRIGYKFFESDPDRSIGVVQWLADFPDQSPTDYIGPVKFLPAPPFTPVLALRDMELASSNRDNFKDLGHNPTWNDTLTAIQKFESADTNARYKFWGYYDDGKKLWACPFPSRYQKYELKIASHRWTYFPIRHWTPTAALVQGY